MEYRQYQRHKGETLSKRIFSSNNFVKTPKIKPPRMDLRHRRKSKAPSKPKDEVEKPDSENEVLSSVIKKIVAFRMGNDLSSHPMQSYGHSAIKPKKKIDPEKKYKLEFKGKDWVFTQVSALSSVNVESDGFTITPETIEYVNTNGNSWVTEDLKKCYRTLLGAMNLKDHTDPADGGIIYGIILDAIPRRIKTSDEKGFIYYIDIIIATNRHIDEEWASAIDRGLVKFVSVGFSCDFLMCSKCGHIYNVNGTAICPHTAFQLNMKYNTNYGGMSRISAVCSDGMVGGLMRFDEVSYLSVDPAFTGAVRSYKLDVPLNSSMVVELPYWACKRPAVQKFLRNKQIRVVK